MKRYKFGLLFITIIAAVSAWAQEEDKSSLERMIAAKQFIFHAQSASPLGGATVQLTSPYDLRISNDSLVSHLPYFGRSFSGGYTGESGIQFTSTSYDYKVKERKRGGWEIRLKPKDQRNVRELQLNISESGYGTLQVISDNRQAISFRGFIDQRN